MHEPLFIMESFDRKRDYSSYRFSGLVETISAISPEEVLPALTRVEAAVAEGRVAFTAPIARAISGCMVGDEVVLGTGQGEQTLEVTAIEYDQQRTE